MAFRAPRTVRKHRSAFETVLGGIGIDQKSGNAKAFRSERLEATVAVRIGISHERNFPSHIDSVFAEVGIVLRITAVRVDERGGYITRSRIPEVCAGNIWVLCIGIHLVGCFSKHCVVGLGRNHLERDVSGRGVQHIVLVNRHIFEPLLSPLLRDPLR